MTDTARKHRVLVVEDEDNIAIALVYLITREGYDCDRVASGGAALAHIRRTHPDLVLLDVMLPEMSGYEICQNMRLDPLLADVKILMATSEAVPFAKTGGLADVCGALPAELTHGRRGVEDQGLIGAVDRDV